MPTQPSAPRLIGHRHLRALIRHAAFIAAFISMPFARAASQTWTGGSVVNGNWSTLGNWSGGAAPGSTSVLNSADGATFNAAIANGWGNLATPIVIDSATQNIGGLTFTGAAGSYTIGTTGGNALLLSSGGSIQIASGLTATNVTQTINAPLALQGTTYSFTNDSARGRGSLVIGGGVTGTTGATTLTLGGTNSSANTISGIIGNGTATSVAVTKSGAGTWVLSGANTYTGATNIGAGVLNIQHGSALGTVAAGTSITSGAALQLQGGITTLAEPLTLRGTGIATDGALRSLSGSNDYAGLVTLGAPSRINTDAGSLTLSHTGTITGATFGLTIGGLGNTTIQSVIGTTTGTLTKDGTGTLTLSRANTYTGRTTVNGGTLALALGSVSSNIISSSSPLTLGGRLQLTGTGTQTVNGLTTTASTGSRILLGSDQTLTLGALTAAGVGSALNFNTATGGANGATVGSGLVVLTGQTAGNAINAGFTVTDAGGFGLATVNASNQIIRLTSTTLLPASGAVAGTNYRIDNNGGGTAAAGSSSLAITASQAANSLTVDTTAANGAVALASGVVLSTNTWNFGGTASNTWASAAAQAAQASKRSLRATPSRSTTTPLARSR